MLGLVIGPATPVGAQTEPADEAAVATIELIDQTALVGADEAFTLTVAVTGLAPEELTMVVAAHAPATDPATLDQPTGAPIATYGPEPLPSGAVRANGVLTVPIPVLSQAPLPSPDGGDDPATDSSGGGASGTEAEAGDGGPAALVLGPSERGGVHPLVVTLQDGNGATAQLTTTLVRLPDPGMDPDQSTGGTLRPAPTAVLVLITEVHDGGEPGVTIEEAITILTEGRTLPATVVLRRTAVDTLHRRPELAARLATAIGERTVVAEQPHPVDPAALAAIGQWRLARRSIAATTTELAALGLTASPRLLAVSAPVTEAGAVALLADGITTVIDLSPRPSLLVPTAPLVGRLSTVAGPLVVLTPGATQVADASFAEGHRSLAALVAWLAGGEPASTGLVTIVPTRTPPSDAGADATTSPGSGHGSSAGPTLVALDRAATAPASQDGTPQDGPSQEEAPQTTAPRMTVSRDRAWFRLTPLDQGLAGVDLAPVEARAEPATDLSTVVEPLGEADRLLATYAASYVSGPRTPSDYLLDLTMATALDLDDDDRAAAVRVVRNELRAAIQVVSLPGNQSVTMAARTAPIPLAIESSAPGPRRVVLRFRSDSLVTAEELAIELPPGSSVIDVEVEARSLGTSPLAVTVLTPDGQQVLATTQFRVRSTAVPGLGLLLSVAGLVLLGAWWFLSIRRGRAGDPASPQPTPDSGPGTNSGPGPEAAPDQESDGGAGGSPIDLRPFDTETTPSRG